MKPKLGRVRLVDDLLHSPGTNESVEGTHGDALLIDLPLKLIGEPNSSQSQRTVELFRDRPHSESERHISDPLQQEPKVVGKSLINSSPKSISEGILFGEPNNI